MLPFQLHISVALIGAAILSLILVAIPHVQRGSNRLRLFWDPADPIYDGEQWEEQELATVRDPFDIIKPEDTIDGEPVNEGGFWRKVKFGKIALLVVYSMLLMDHIVSLAYTLEAYSLSSILCTLPSNIHLVFAFYLLALTSIGLAASTVDEHWPIVVHIASLSFLSTIAQCISLLVPNEGAIQISQIRPPFALFGGKFQTELCWNGDQSDKEDMHIFWYASLLLSASSMVISAMIPLGPELYFPPERVYTLKSIETAAKERGEDPTSIAATTRARKANVIGLVSSSSLGILLFDYSTRVVMLGYTSLSLETADLPILVANLRAPAIFANIRRQLYTLKQARSPDQPPTPSKWTTYQITIRLPFASTLVRVLPALERRFPSITEPRTIAPFGHSGGAPPWVRLWMQLAKANRNILLVEVILSFISAFLPYIPIIFLKKFIAWLEYDPRRAGRQEAGGPLAWFVKPNPDDYFPFKRESDRWAWVYCAGIFGATILHNVLIAQVWSLSTTVVQLRIKTQLNTTIFAKTLARKNVISTATDADGKEKEASKGKKKGHKSNGATPLQEDAGEDTATRVAGTDPTDTPVNTNEATEKAKNKDQEEFSSKAQVMTLMTTDVDRVAAVAWHIFTLVDFPIEVVIGSYFVYTFLGISAFYGLAATFIFFPINHWASKVVFKAQNNLMSARDERVALINEVLGGIRMLKFMSLERMFEKRISKIRERELSYQWRNYVVETLFNTTMRLSPILVCVIAFWHYAVIRQLPLTPSVAFTSLTVFMELRYALSYLPELFVALLQTTVSLRRIAKYLDTQEASSAQLQPEQALTITLNAVTISWPQERTSSGMTTVAGTPIAATLDTIPLGGSTSGTPRRKFVLMDLTLDFPQGELSLICGKLGSGKTLLLLALLGEADVLTGQLICPRSPPNAMTALAQVSPDEDWLLQTMCAYVPQVAWLQNASIKENILFNLPYDEKRYRATLEACALLPDLAVLEDGDESEIGERGVNLSGGQKARVSLARAVYSRASTLLFDDVLSAVDAHTAQYLYDKCICGPLMKGRTVILVSHHIQLCALQAKYIVALDRGKLLYQGSSVEFLSSPIMEALIRSKNRNLEASAAGIVDRIEDNLEVSNHPGASRAGETSTTETVADVPGEKPTAPKKLVEDEARRVGRIGKDIWKSYVDSAGGPVYWSILILALILASLDPVAENGWIKIWSGAVNRGDNTRNPLWYMVIYALIATVGLVVFTLQFIIFYHGSINASHVLHRKLLKAILFAPIRFHDTTNRGRLLNRFGKDFEGIDSSLPDSFGRSLMSLFALIATISTVTFVGGWPFFLTFVILGLFYYEVSRVYGQTARDMRRLDSVSRSPLYSIYGEAITGIAVIRAFGAPSKFMRDMLSCVDTNSAPYYWLWGVNRWVSVRLDILSAVMTGITAAVIVQDTSIDASYAGLAMTFISGVSFETFLLVRRFVSLEQSMVAVERVKEYSELAQEPPEFVEPRPPASWPSSGAIKVEHLSIRYAPDLPNALHDLSFQIVSGQKIGILGRTGGGKSTLALSFFRFVEAYEGRIIVDGLDISKMGLTDLRSRLTIIPQDPTILSGTLRSTLDIFEEYEDAEIYDALRRVHLLPSNDEIDENVQEDANMNVFRNLDSPVSEGGENLSAGEKQLICMARAILKRTKILFMDEATASVDYATDELIGKTIRHEFEQSTVLTIAHRIRTVIDYDRVMILDKGRIVEYDKPSTLLADPKSQFYALCKATGPDEFSVLFGLSNASASS